MNILFFGSEANLDLYRTGGIESTVRRLIKFLVEYNHKIFVFVISSEKYKIDVKLEQGIITIVYDSVENLTNRLLNEKFHIINFLQTPFKNLFFLLKLLVKKKRDNILFIKWFFTYPPFKRNFFQQKIKHFLFIDRYIVFSKRLYESLYSLKRENVFLLNPPVPYEYYKHANTRPKNKSICFTGRISEDKGIEIVIEVFKKLVHDNNIQLNIIGYYSNESDKEKYEPLLNQLNIDINIEKVKKTKFTKMMEESILPLRNFEILFLPYQKLLPTLDTPLLVLEGLAAGCKIITSDIGNLDQFQDNLFLVKDYHNHISFLTSLGKKSYYAF